ncbi:adhesin-like protein [Candida orthopsilosis Co 90-125]|uniref:Adhesin-like protein n=1 Tax=Candida orthopsilosis (strain 90-125) TaxID=1136231 RepID=H8X3L9_CANO9|nr:adhesin-like protein [Candida orthopsilosis Co 90-125]CCG25657.1 adhesin-like protein [Candida orthopsilosis Co 90-125]
MISDSQLNTIALTFGFASIILILVYHAISTNINNLQHKKKVQ